MNLDHIRDNLRIGDNERSDTVYVDDEPFFTMHGGITSHSAINIVGTDKAADHVLIGSGTCCHGYIAQMDQLGKEPHKVSNQTESIKQLCTNKVRYGAATETMYFTNLQGSKPIRRS